MLYLEDYLEMIEHLPQELRDRFTEMREMDLQVQNSMDSLEKRVKTFFGNAKKMKSQDKESEYESIKKDYYKTLEDADEKVQLGNHMYDLVARYLRHLDQETHKFKMELEADHIGITEILEKRSQELDQPPSVMSGNGSQKENRYSMVNSGSRSSNHQGGEKRRDRESVTVSNSSSSSSGFSNTAGASGHSQYMEHSLQHKRMTAEKHIPDFRLSANAIMQTVMPLSPQPNPPVKYPSLEHIGAGGTAIAAAASQAIAATQQMQQGRRTASLKASYEAIHSVGQHGSTVSACPQVPGEINISKELAGAAQTAIAAIQDNKKHKKKSTVSSGGASTSVNVGINNSSNRILDPGSGTITTIPGANIGFASISGTSQSMNMVAPAQHSPQDSGDYSSDVVYDPNEPRYCICNEIAFGEMVACDNKSCPYEWYHYPCVGITDTPKGKWYCPQCTAVMKRRGSRKN